MNFFDVEPLTGYRPDVGLLLASLKDSTREWRDELGLPTVDAIVWQPEPNFHSVGAELLHIADVEMYWIETVAGKIPPNSDDLKLFLSEETKQDDSEWPAPRAHPIEWYFEHHNRIRERAFETAKNIDPDTRFEMRGYTFTFQWILAHVVEHDSYHGGQAVLLHELWKRRLSAGRRETGERE